MMLRLILLLSFTSPLWAAIDPYKFEDPSKQATYQTLIEELRCLVCQNQNLADSNAELALDLRKQTYELVQEGKSRDEVADYMVTRYGDFVLYKPPFNYTTALLWLGPFIILFVGAYILIGFIRARTKENIPQMSDEDRDKMEKLLAEKSQENS